MNFLSGNQVVRDRSTAPHDYTTSFFTDEPYLQGGVGVVTRVDVTGVYVWWHGSTEFFDGPHDPTTLRLLR